MGAAVGGWLAIVGAFALGVLALKLKDLFKRLVDKAEEALYRRLAGSVLLSRTALRRYTVKVYEQHRSFSVSFRPEENQAMDMASVYVPLRTASGLGAAAEQREAAATLHECRRAVVLGVPGAGKTMLLRHTVLDWARQRYRPDLPPRRTWYDPRRRPRVSLGTATDIPVLLSLHSVDLDAGDLTAHMVNHFAEHDFPNARTWVERSLADGRLAVYFDGLDEVPTTQRARVAAAIRHFMSVYDGCRAVVTCRVAVYRGEFAEAAVPVLRVEEFDDQLIQRFLRGWPWPDTLGPDTVEQLLGALLDTPQLMPLARNPLLLTMIAYLYSYEYAGTGQALPHNRTDFYEQVTISLLRDRQRDAHFAQPVKRVALQRLALAAQDVPSGAYDRLAIPFAKVLPALREGLERHGRPGDGAEDMLNEIVDRSGLLLSVDNGERFQFAHLTLQEYLAATALADAPAVLLQHYRRDPAVWRETVRLWCGVVSRDCSDVMREILQLDPLLAFQCLADAQVVDNALAIEIVTMFHARLGDGIAGLEGAERDAVIAAFGLVAADRRPQGRAVFDLLKETAEEPGNTARAQAAIDALVATRLSETARFFVSRFEQLPGAKAALASMSDLAVAVLAPGRELPVASAAEMLWIIRTPRAIAALCKLLDGLLDSDDSEGAQHVAFRLADLLREGELIATLQTFPQMLGGRSRILSRYWWWRAYWVWLPFLGNRDGSSLWRLAATLALLLQEAAESGMALPPGVEPDPRLVMPLALVDYGTSGPRQLSLAAETVDPALRADLDDLLGGSASTAQVMSLGRRSLAELGARLATDEDADVSSQLPDEARAELGRRLMTAAGLSEARVRMLSWLRPELCLRAVLVLTRSGIARKEAWMSGTMRLGSTYFLARYLIILLAYLMLSIAPCAKVGAVLLDGWSWGVQGPLGIAFLALNAVAPTVFPLIRFFSRGMLGRTHVQFLRQDIWTWVTFVAPIGGCIAVVEWWGTWASGAVGVIVFVGMICLIQPLATPRAREEFMDEGMPSLIRSLAQP